MNWRAGLVLSIAAFAGGVLAYGWLGDSGLIPWESSSTAVEDGVMPQANSDATTSAIPEAAPMLAAPVSPQLVVPVADSARTEAMLVALATRRAITAGTPLGDNEARLKAAFGTTQPGAVEQILSAQRDKLTPALLLSEFDKIAPTLTQKQGTLWEKAQKEMATLFVLRRSDTKPAGPDAALDRVRTLLATGNVRAAVRSVSTMPGSNGAKSWLALAARYQKTEEALEILERSALTQAPAAPVVPAPPADAPAQPPVQSEAAPLESPTDI
ncbi:hypothetical protein [Sphingorhabdus sp.]|uniref:hypothetical protein n=1 Tax=Sphingorhabdus sp. TaxID=1902408 RepID=UPI003BAFC5F0|nr:hypothetical protein [Sphingomonadales bacterium]MBL0022762.1 hypothetical protein [Sphingomonadales bacterium]